MIGRRNRKRVRKKSKFIVHDVNRLRHNIEKKKRERGHKKSSRLEDKPCYKLVKFVFIPTITLVLHVRQKMRGRTKKKARERKKIYG